MLGIQKIYREEGIRGFYKGLTASFLGIAETAFYFVLYEKAKYWYAQHKHAQLCDEAIDFDEYIKSM